MKLILRDSVFTLTLFIVLAIGLVIETGCGASKVSTPAPTPTPTPQPTTAAAPSITGGWQMILVSNNSANQNTVLEANLTETGAVGAANSQNVLAFGLQSGHTQIDGSPITFTGQCGAANALSVTLSSYTWNPAPTANTAEVATSNISLNFTEGSVAFSGTATGVIGSAYPFGPL